MKIKLKITALLLVLLISLTSCEILDDILAGLPLPDLDNTPTDTDEPTDTENPSDTDKPTYASGEHVDEDNDGYCDDCGEYVVIVLDFYAVNDMHGKFVDTSSNVGAGGLATYLKASMAMDDNAILLSSGDMWQGSSESNLTHGFIMTEWMNELGFVSMTMGNHEYDWGTSYIEENAELATFPLLAINIMDSSTNERVDYCEASVVVERSGLKIGIIGAIGDCYSSISSDMTKGVYFETGADLTSLIKEESERLREEEDVDFVVLSLHDGSSQKNSSASFMSSKDLSSYYDTRLSSGYVDLVFEAHTHKSYIYYDSEYVYHMQGGGENSGISHIELNVNFANGKKSVNSAEIVSSSVYKKYESDPIVDSLLSKYENDIEKADEVLGTVSRTVYSSELLNLTARLYYEKGQELWGENYNIVLGGGFMSARSPYNLYSGTVTYSNIYSIMPFDNSLVLCSVSVANLKRVFIETTNNRYYTYYEGLDVSKIEDDKTYYVITDTYTSTYKYNNLTEIQRYNESVFARDLLADYIKAGKLK